MARRKAAVPGARQKLNEMKYEVADEVGVQMKKSDNGDMTSRDAGRVGGNMVKKMVQYAEKNMPEKNKKGKT
ncbi:MAG: alpha/beta-type small acid-soluble spore protein [Eubacteriales bacterium]|nr:alpha/beta-type small acid-soluble spore protein [Eubacteriales bacterium]